MFSALDKLLANEWIDDKLNHLVYFAPKESRYITEFRRLNKRKRRFLHQRSCIHGIFLSTFQAKKD